ncbi:hypothetical protein LZ31DRAFT_303294 [Colletotrichum somersetense]|nr:hypothetical protein LZ31DRAFT_303294 [Colletotrichum somersetense]
MRWFFSSSQRITAPLVTHWISPRLFAFVSITPGKCRCHPILLRDENTVLVQDTGCRPKQPGSESPTAHSGVVVCCSLEISSQE